MSNYDWGGYRGSSNPPPGRPRRFRPIDTSSDRDEAPPSPNPPPSNTRRMYPPNRGGRSSDRDEAPPSPNPHPSNSRRVYPPNRGGPSSEVLPKAAHLRMAPAPGQGNGPYKSDRAFQPSQVRSTASQNPGAPCTACYNMDPRKQPERLRKNPILNEDEMQVLLANFVRESEYCPFCSLLHRIFLAYVDGAKDTITRVMNGYHLSLMGTPEARVVVPRDQPAVITFREGIHTKQHATRDEIVDEKEEKLPGRLCYPPPIQVYWHGEKIPGWPRLGSLRHPEQKVGESFQFFEDKLYECRTTHKACNQGLRSLPRRLLDIGYGDEGSIKLVDSKELLRNHPVYVAVSHRWTDDPDDMLRTLIRNFKDHLQLINVDRCPRVLQDAIRVARALGVQYLWMDTLCLIQDDPEDKGQELGKMGDYYKNAYFTIAASSSNTTLVPFLDRRRSYYEPQMFPFGKNGNSAVYARRLGVEGFLAKRGWIWQESAFSGRVLNFAPSELIWECREQVESECGYEPNPFPSLGLARQYQNIGNRPFQVWRDLVRTYSARRLGYFNDFLPAISGLAERIQRQTGSEYYAGIWEQDLIPSLLWKVTRGFDRISEPFPRVPYPRDPNTDKDRECRAPSWSWASVQGSITTAGTDIKGSSKRAGYPLQSGNFNINEGLANMTSDIRNPKVEGLSQETPNSSFGEVAGGLLKLEGRLIPVELTYTDRHDTGWTYELKFPRDRFSMDVFYPDTQLEPFPKYRWSDNFVQTAVRANDVPKAQFSVTVHCLRIARESTGPGRHFTDHGFVLGRSKDNNSLFKRIGSFKFVDSSYFDRVSPQAVTIA